MMGIYRAHPKTSSFRYIPLLVIFALFAVNISFLLVSCSVKLTGAVQKDSSAEIFISCDFGAKTATLLRSISGAEADTTAKNAVLIDVDMLNESLKKANGINAANFRSKGGGGIEGGISISKIGDFLKPSKGNNFITFTPEKNGLASKIVIDISLKNSGGILLSISEDFQDYLSAIMAPCATGEKLTKAEYLKLLSDVYGKDIAAEINSAHFKANLSFPNEIKTIKGGTKNGNTASFDIALIDILVLENALALEVQW